MRRRSTGLVSAAVDALRQIDDWPSPNAAAGVVRGGETLATHGDPAVPFAWASVTKPVTSLAVLVAAEEGTLDLDEPAGPPGSTVRHLLAHASGLPFEGRTPIGEPGQRRIYSNSGFDVLGELLAERAEMPFGTYLREAVLEPLGMAAVLRGPAGSGIEGSLNDLLRFVREVQRPSLVAPETLEEATTVQFPGLAGVIPDLGRFDPNDWGLGFELRDEKPGHFSGTRTSARTFGHWGGAGTFFWVDPDEDRGLAVLTDLRFGDWAKEAWPRLSDAVSAAP
jgi:CubicO group peptidase (beta-lactamase class C family)